MKVIVLLMALTCVICQKPVAEDASVIYEKGKKSINQFLIELGRSEDDLADNGDLVHRSCRKRVPSDMVSQKSKRARSLDSVGETEGVEGLRIKRARSRGRPKSTAADRAFQKILAKIRQNPEEVWRISDLEKEMQLEHGDGDAPRYGSRYFKDRLCEELGSSFAVSKGSGGILTSQERLLKELFISDKNCQDAEHDCLTEKKRCCQKGGRNNRS